MKAIFCFNLFRATIEHFQKVYGPDTDSHTVISKHNVSWMHYRIKQGLLRQSRLTQ